MQIPLLHLVGLDVRLIKNEQIGHGQAAAILQHGNQGIAAGTLHGSIPGHPPFHDGGCRHAKAFEGAEHLVHKAAAMHDVQDRLAHRQGVASLGGGHDRFPTTARGLPDHSLRSLGVGHTSAAQEVLLNR